MRSKPRIQTPRVKTKFFWMGFFGHRLAKASHLVGLAPGIQYLHTVKPNRSANRKRNALRAWKQWWQWTPEHGWRRRCMGLSELSSSQVYPEAFCKEMAKIARYSAAIFKLSK